MESKNTALAYRVAEDIVKDLREIHQAENLGAQERRPLRSLSAIPHALMVK